MKRLLLWLANRRRADVIDEQSITWTWGRLSLVVLTHSDAYMDNRPLDHTAIWLSLVGVYVANSRDYVRAPAVRLWRSTQPLNVLLADAGNFEEAMLTLAWMTHEEMRFDTDRQVWLLTWV